MNRPALRESAAAEVEQEAVEEGMRMLRAHISRVEIIVMLDQAVGKADAIRGIVRGES